MARDELAWRLIDGREHPSPVTRMRVQARIATARLLDSLMAGAGLTKPVVFVSGFWRSGTTWLQESLAEALRAKTVFEPLSPLNSPRRAALAARFLDDEDAAQAFIPGPEDDLDKIWTVFDCAAASHGTDPFTLGCRWFVSESLRRTVVLKDVRSQRLLAPIHARYGVPVIHLRRHPCDVVSSLIRANWHWSFARVRLSALLPISALAEEADPNRFDQDEISRIAACWAWSERCAAESLADQDWARVITYEDMARDPESVLGSVCSALRLRPTTPVAFDRASATIEPREYKTRQTHAERWRQSLAKAEIDRVERIATAIYPAWRDAFRHSAG